MTSPFRRGVWIFAAFWLAACGASAPGAAQTQPPAAARKAGAGSELAFLRKPRPAEIYLADGRTYTIKQNPDGTFPDTVGGPKGELAVESLRRAYFIAAAGVLAEGAEQEKLLDQGLKAFEWGFTQAGEDGSFPNERGGVKKKQNSLHPKAVYIEASARTLLLLQQAAPDARTRARVEALTPALYKSANWMANSPDTSAFFQRVKNTNQLMSVAAGLQEASLVTGKPELAVRARGMMEQILARQLADGAFPEKGGFDSNYQTLSLELLGRYYATLEPSPWRDRIGVALRKGLDRFLLVVDPQTGVINDDGNSRTVACGAPVEGSGPKGKDLDIVPLRLYYLGFLLDDEARLAPLAERILATGQSFSHSDKCEAGKRGKAG
ncbi:MAG: hypothetical protein QE280_07135, partial [Caulobacter sp.]|nr:hypothetical protein [Caulobacter sp.]